MRIFQSDPKAIYQLIVSDLKFAAANIPATAYPKSAAATNDGRAIHLLLKRYWPVFIYFMQAIMAAKISVSPSRSLAGLEEVISSGQFALVADFKNLWPAASYIPNASNNTLDISKYAGKGNAEVVFAQKFNNTSNYNGYVDGNRWVVFLGLRGKIGRLWPRMGGMYGKQKVLQ
jgi:hypothetical protein